GPQRCDRAGLRAVRRGSRRRRSARSVRGHHRARAHHGSPRQPAQTANTVFPHGIDGAARDCREQLERAEPALARPLRRPRRAALVRPGGSRVVAHASDAAGRDINRSAGVLLHPTSLPGRYGIGDLGDELIAFLDWAASAGMRLWQVLPLNPPGFGNSPYGCHSSFAGNPLLISPQRLMQRHLLPKKAIDRSPQFPNDHIDFDAVRRWKNDLLRTAWRHFEERGSRELREDLSRFTLEEREWLEDWALYAALKEKFGGAAWWEWDRAIAQREEQAVAGAKRELADTIAFHEF